ncbi:MAG: glycoside hydrolase family 2 protein [Bacteroidetes bacterium]|nr:glycoside hydrolase family 2 protein [Bacteroidota bacterium]
MKKLFCISVLFLIGYLSYGQSREQHLLNNNWNFSFGYETKPDLWTRVEIPHTWNKEDALNGKVDYYRGQATYEKVLFVDKAWEGKRLFLKFDGVNTVCNVFINDKHIGEHRGGYTAFIFEITDKVNFGADNKIRVRVSNALQLDVMPLVGDFNFYGGIYRDVHLIVTDKSCISPLDFASSGVYLTQSSISKEKAVVDAKVLISNGTIKTNNYVVQIDVKDGSKTVCTQTAQVKAEPEKQTEISLPIKFSNPHLWNGIKDPFIYTAVVSLKQGDKVIDVVEQPLGLRYYTIDPDKGFFLNGEHLQLRGVCRHQDRSEVGNALYPENQEEDIALMLEMGVNAIRLSHYPNAPYFYDILDKSGIVTWSEIPFVGPGGYRDQGFVDQPSFRENGKNQLLEMIRQNYNHPGVCFWGLFNELKVNGDNPVEYLKELNAIAHREDPSRRTTAATFIDGEITGITDLICWNKYYGWYGGDAKEIGKWADETHQKSPTMRIGISEYGAGASIYHHEQDLKRPNPSGYWHPEAWQAYYHEENWKQINERPYLWGTFIWNMFDFGAAHRTEGDRPGRNDKGLVTIDRKVKKDAFWFYKANWNKNEPVLYIANKRFVNRIRETTNIKVYSNFPEVELFVNGFSQGKRKGDYAIFNWDTISLIKGKNKIEVKANNGNKVETDYCIWNVE